MTAKKNILATVFIVLLFSTSVTPTNIFISAVCFSGCGTMLVTCYVITGLEIIKAAVVDDHLPKSGCKAMFQECKAICVKSYKRD